MLPQACLPPPEHTTKPFHWLQAPDNLVNLWHGGEVVVAWEPCGVWVIYPRTLTAEEAYTEGYRYLEPAVRLHPHPVEEKLALHFHDWEQRGLEFWEERLNHYTAKVLSAENAGTLDRMLEWKVMAEHAVRALKGLL